MKTTGTANSITTLDLLVAAAWELDPRRINRLASEAADQRLITNEDADDLLRLAHALYTTRPVSKMYRPICLKIQAWAAKYGA